MQVTSRKRLCLALLVFTISGISQARGNIIGVAMGSGDPATTLGGYSMTPFALESRTSPPNVNSAVSPLGGTVSFSNFAGIWSPSAFSWGNSFSGNVYLNALEETQTVLTLPSNTVAFYLFSANNNYAGFHDTTVTAQDGTAVTQTISDAFTGAKGFGFYATGGDTIQTLTISGPNSAGLAFGEFAIAGAPHTAAPEPSTLAMFGGFALIAWIRRVRHKS